MDAEVVEVLEELAEECTRSGDRAQARAEETSDQYDELRASGRAEGWHGAARRIRERIDSDTDQ
jgi:hypothetical protein